MLLTIVIAVGMWPIDCLHQIVISEFPDRAEVHESYGCSSLSGFEWATHPFRIQVSIVGALVVVTAVSFLMWKRHARSS